MEEEGGSDGEHIVYQPVNAGYLQHTEQEMGQTVSTINPVSRKTHDAIHHVSEAIKSLRLARQLQTTRPELSLESGVSSVCACGEPDCNEACDIRKWLPTSKIDDKMREHVIILEESYLALGQTYKDDGQLYRALKAVELACLIYESMPQDARFVSSMVCSPSSVHGDVLTTMSPNYRFWSTAWTLVGDVYAKFYSMKGQEVSMERDKKEKKNGQFNKKKSKKSYGRRSRLSGKETQRISDAMQEMNLAAARTETADGSKGKTAEETLAETTNSKGKTLAKDGGIFKYLIRGSVTGDADYNLSVAVSCYEEARKAMGGRSAELQSLLEKKGWACNELGRNRLEMKDMGRAETAFSQAIDAFRQVEDHENVILVYCNWGYGRRALAEDMVSKVESLKKHAIFHDAYMQALETTKLQYIEALRYYGAAKLELSSFVEKAGPLSSSLNLKNEVNTQFAHTYLKLGMLLARENTVAEVYGNCVREDCSSTQTQIEHKRHEISANDAIREALAVYESLGECRKQEAAYAHFQLASYQRDCCLRLLENDVKQTEEHWQKSIDLFYGPETCPEMYLNILIDRSAFSFELSDYQHSSTVRALTHLLEGRRVSSPRKSLNPDVCDKFWSQLQKVLKQMLVAEKANKSADYEKLSQLYSISLKTPDFNKLQEMHRLWTA